METKSVSDCLNFIDAMIICCIENIASIKILEDIRTYI